MAHTWKRIIPFKIQQPAPTLFCAGAGYCYRQFQASIFSGGVNSQEANQKVVTALREMDLCFNTALTEAEVIQCAIDEGFAAAAVVNTDKIVFDPYFRPYCEENLCGQYGANYTCPPDCGSPEEMKQRILAHKKVLVLQTIWQAAEKIIMNEIVHN